MGLGGGRGGGSEGPRGALGRAPGDYTHDSRAGRRHARGAGLDACGQARPTRRGGGRNGWRGGRRQEHRPNGPHGARPYVPDRAPLSPRSARAPQPPTYARGGGRNGWRGGRPEQHRPSARPEHRFHAANTRGGGGRRGAHERNPDRGQSHRQQTPTRRAANTRFPPKPPPANTDPPRGKQRPTDLARSALVSRSLRARCALRAPRAARTGRLWRHVNRLADWENGSPDYLKILRCGCEAALHNQSSRWIFFPSAASLSIYRLRTGSYLDRIWF